MADDPTTPPAGAGPNPFGAQPAEGAPRSNDPVPPDADLPRDPTLERDETDRAEFDAWRDTRDADAAARGEALNGEEACPACGASVVNPAHHERLPYCWKCGFGAGAGQDYPVQSHEADR